MFRSVLFLAMAFLIGAFGLAGCASADRQAVLHNLEGCERHYLGTVSGGVVGAGFSGSVRIDCAKGDAATPPAEPPV